jgi:hypothetical protein
MMPEVGKIICVGFQKTGTSSLVEALRILGYEVKDNSLRPLIPILKGNFNRILRMITDYDAVADTPWNVIYKELDRQIPGSKFILTVREEEAWYRSVYRHIGILRNPSHEWIYGRGKGLPMDDKENTLRVYRNHNREVIEYFKDRPGDLMVVDFTNGAGWEELCSFLDKGIPERPFPHANQGKNILNGQPYFGYHKDLRFYRTQFKHSVRMKYIDMRNLW